MLGRAPFFGLLGILSEQKAGVGILTLSQLAQMTRRIFSTRSGHAFTLEQAWYFARDATM